MKSYEAETQEGQQFMESWLTDAYAAAEDAGWQAGMDHRWDETLDEEALEEDAALEVETLLRSPSGSSFLAPLSSLGPPFPQGVLLPRVLLRGGRLPRGIRPPLP